MRRSTCSCAAMLSRILTVDVLKAAFKPDRVVVKELLRAHTLDERSWDRSVPIKKAPVRIREAKAKRAA